MDFFVGGEDGFLVVFEWGSVGTGDAAAGFFDDEGCGCDVPGIEAEFPESVECSVCDVAEIECG